MEARTILVPAVTSPDLWPTNERLPGVLTAVVAGSVVEVGAAAVLDLCCSKRFYQWEEGFNA